MILYSLSTEQIVKFRGGGAMLSVPRTVQFLFKLIEVTVYIHYVYCLTRRFGTKLVNLQEGALFLHNPVD